MVGYTRKLNTNDHLVWHDKALHNAIVKNALEFYEIDMKEVENFSKKELQESGTKLEKTSVSQALKHYVRDWSSEGERERMDAFPCILNTLLTHFPSRPIESVKVLLPGAGFGRLGHDIHTLGGESGIYIPNVMPDFN